jgi:hypothetical protein
LCQRDAILRHRASLGAVPCGWPSLYRGAFLLCHRAAISSIAPCERCSLCSCRFSWSLSAARVCFFSWMPLVFCDEAQNALACVWYANASANQSLFLRFRQSVPLWPLICRR